MTTPIKESDGGCDESDARSEESGASREESDGSSEEPDKEPDKSNEESDATSVPSRVPDCQRSKPAPVASEPSESDQRCNGTWQLPGGEKMDEQTKRMIIRNLAADLFLDPQDKHVDALSPERKKDFEERLAAVDRRMEEIHISDLESFGFPSLYPESSLYDGICAKCGLFAVYDRGCSKCGFSHVLSFKMKTL